MLQFRRENEVQRLRGNRYTSILKAYHVQDLELHYLKITEALEHKFWPDTFGSWFCSTEG
jgi:hypothetical protein